jgi:L-2-hydroxyglutarate oxidase LhgO
MLDFRKPLISNKIRGKRVIVKSAIGQVKLDVEMTIIGAGVVGLAIAARYSQDHKNVFVIEKNEKFGRETSSRNSEVIHAGIRPKLQKPGDTFRDFIIQEESAKGLPGVVNLLGIESPGLTASLAIANYVKGILP